ncbi:MAG: mechanosensitive ion channel [Fidelibacterota bacterium]|nr:MAG: mechanosensitive ion channel [Candidatus Neomarinimicrobiota bacterium]
MKYNHYASDRRVDNKTDLPCSASIFLFPFRKRIVRIVETSCLINGRRLSNVGTFRAYVEAYLRSHPLIHQEITLLVRQLDPEPKGLPIEFYAFSKDTRWGNYEAIQADIFDHILAVVPLKG